ncbi:hypothetical protein [Klebsiella pneumoniae]|uniref:hypothetical protein n=1 Tax=Klebsiella pneumoniae TaxID=573 RepID=UPI0007CD1CB8|nr:hypothetical protein [Klebsiella pneumoniae]HDH1412648.1 hypothetical protein [Klebsiella quasipneumoniae subsp. similipneumoniae]HDS3242525.1 hypothetical protein [Klebsiella aerogenes]ATU19585.1 hypothetical protein KPH11_25510 [Klebsiella pneumoniae subsp. pneumoniae]EKX4251175.1 hypothetical protein [Klebsiella pneumoniae]EKX7967662.1 hypothetical protein [Klebsiella pneumoniae]
MTQIASKILGTVNAPYGANLSACQLAACISDIAAAQSAMGHVFSFFSEVAPELQNDFVAEMGLSAAKVRVVAETLQASCPFPLALAA